MTIRAARWLILCWFAGCSADSNGRSDAIVDSAAPRDAARADASSADASRDDAASSDAAPLDSGASDSGAADAGPKPTYRVLFVGNSYSAGNGLPTVLRALSMEEQSPAIFAVDKRTPGGATWYSHDVNQELTEHFRRGWHYVVLQDQSGQPWGSVGTKDELRSLDAKIKDAGGQTIMFMTWARAPTTVSSASFFKMNLAVNNYYERHAAAIDATVAPIGRAWERAYREPGVSLHIADGSHANERGTYLAACVLYIALTGESPVGLGTGGLTVTDEERAMFQRVAWQTHVSRQRQTSPAVGTWALAADMPTHDIVPGELLTLGDALGTDGTAGGATRFGYDGTTLKAASIPYFDGMNADEMTISFDAHRTDWNVATSSVQVMLSKSWGYSLEQRGDELQAKLHVEGSSRPTELAFSAGGLAAGWHQIALSYDGATYALWIDATQVATATATGDIRYYQAADTEDLRFNGIALGARFTDRFEGVDTTTPDSGFTGSMSNIRLFDRALSAAELRDL